MIPNAIAMDPDTDMVYVGVWGTVAGVIVINGATNGVAASFTSSVPCGSATAAAYDSSAHRVYVTFSGLNCQRMFVLNGTTWSPITSVPLPSDPEAITVDPSARTIYIAYLSGALVRYSSANYAATGTVTIPAASSVAVNKQTHVAYAAPSQPGPGAIRLTNPAATAVTGSVPVPGPGWLALAPITGALVYATSGTSGSTVSVIEPAPPKITSSARATFTVGRAGSFKALVQGSPAPRLSEQGRLPAGVAFAADGTLRGTPRTGTAGVYPITFTAAANGIGPAATQRFTLTVDARPAIISSARATFKAGVRATFHRPHHRVPRCHRDRARHAAARTAFHRAAKRQSDHHRNPRLGGAWQDLCALANRPQRCLPGRDPALHHPRVLTGRTIPGISGPATSAVHQGLPSVRGADDLVAELATRL